MPFDGIRGHRALAERLADELATRPSHAYLFSGPRGVGKALVASALAHGLLCERSPGAGFCCTPEDCAVRLAAAALARERAGAAGEAARCECCAACVQTASGVHPDFTRIGRAPNRTDVLIEQVRELIAQLGIKPSRAPRRVAIIDDAETLNLPGQNALLKTLEEPPGHAIIFVVTATERALLDTVRSRTRPVRFAGLSIGDLEAILAAHGIADRARAGALARLARGSAGRALALADGGEPPMKELLEALAGARKLDFTGAQRIAQDFFANREQAADNFELLARLLEEILCYKLLGEPIAAAAPEAAAAMTEIARGGGANALAGCLEGAVRARAAIDAMANSRLQAEQWWMSASELMRSE
jgi:DNA polymerase III subunit delta'